jgi:hypothetical protein
MPMRALVQVLAVMLVELLLLQAHRFDTPKRARTLQAVHWGYERSYTSPYFIRHCSSCCSCCGRFS